jgi:hypothetical protein
MNAKSVFEEKVIPNLIHERTYFSLNEMSDGLTRLHARILPVTLKGYQRKQGSQI